MTFKWNKIKQDAFDEIKRIMAHDTLLNYPDFIEFNIHSNARKFQLGEVIIQKDKSIALYSIKLTDTHKRYTVTEKGLISNVDTLKEFRTISLSHRLEIYTDHKNLTCNNYNTDIVLIWIVILEE